MIPLKILIIGILTCLVSGIIGTAITIFQRLPIWKKNGFARAKTVQEWEIAKKHQEKQSLFIIIGLAFLISILWLPLFNEVEDYMDINFYIVIKYIFAIVLIVGIILSTFVSDIFIRNRYTKTVTIKKGQSLINQLKKQNYLKTIIFIIIAILLVTIITMGIFSNKNKAKVIEIRTFSEIPGFSFDYPVFEGWEVKGIEKKSDNEDTIWLNWPEDIELEHPPYISIKKIEERKIPDFESISDLKENKNKVNYEFVYFPKNYVEGYQPKGYWDTIHFYTYNSVNGALITIPIGSGHGFDRDVFAGNIIETFKFGNQTNGNVSNVKITDKKINISTYKDLPEQAVKFIPKNGILFVSGGFMSSGRRMAIDFDKKTLEYFMNQGSNSNPYEIKPNKAKYLSDDQIGKIVELSNKIWESNKSYANESPIADFDVTLILSSYGDAVRYYKVINSYGPAREEVEGLYDYVWSLVQ